MAIKDFKPGASNLTENNLDIKDLQSEFTLTSELDASGNFKGRDNNANISQRLSTLQNTKLSEFYRGGKFVISPTNSADPSIVRVGPGPGLKLSEVDPSRGPIPTFLNDDEIKFNQAANIVSQTINFSTNNQFISNGLTQFGGATTTDPTPGVSNPNSQWRDVGWSWYPASDATDYFGNLVNPNPKGSSVFYGLPFIAPGTPTATGNNSSDIFLTDHTGFNWDFAAKRNYDNSLSSIATDPRYNPSGNTDTWLNGNRDNNYIAMTFSGGGSIFSQPAATGTQYRPTPLPDFLTFKHTDGSEDTFAFDAANEDLNEDSNFWPFGSSDNVITYIWPNVSDTFMEKYSREGMKAGLVAAGEDANSIETTPLNGIDPRLVPEITYTSKSHDSINLKVYGNKEITAPAVAHSGSTPAPGDRLQFGSVIAVSQDGNTMVVGAGGNEQGSAGPIGTPAVAGRIHIYERDLTPASATYKEFIRKDTVIDPASSGGGESTTLTNTGFGGRVDDYGPRNGPNRRAYNRSEYDITSTRDNVTTPIAISKDGKIIVVGSPIDANGGKVRVFVRNDSTREWESNGQAALTYSDAEEGATGTVGLSKNLLASSPVGNSGDALKGILYGESVALSEDGIYLVIGCRNYPATGRVFVYKKAVGNYNYNFHATISPPFGEGSADPKSIGHSLWTSTQYSYSNSVYPGGKYPALQYAFGGEIINIGNGSRSFGYSIDISGNTAGNYYIAISAPGVDHQTRHIGGQFTEGDTRYFEKVRGSVYAYKINSGATGWDLQQTLNLPFSEYEGMKKIYSDIKSVVGDKFVYGYAYSSTPPLNYTENESRSAQTSVKRIDNNYPPAYRFWYNLHAALPDIYGLKVQIRCDQTQLDSNSPSDKGVIFIGRNDYNISVPEVVNTLSEQAFTINSRTGLNTGNFDPPRSLADGYIGGGYFPGAGSIDVWTLNSSETEWTRQDKIISPLEKEEINYLKNLGTLGLSFKSASGAIANPNLQADNTLRIQKLSPNVGGSHAPGARRQFGYNFDVSPNAQYLTAVKLSDQNKAFFVTDEFTADSTITDDTKGFLPKANRRYPEFVPVELRNTDPNINLNQEYLNVVEDSPTAITANIYGQPINSNSGGWNKRTKENSAFSIVHNQVSYFRSPTPEIFKFNNFLEDISATSAWQKVSQAGVKSRDTFTFKDPALQTELFLEENTPSNVYEAMPQRTSDFTGSYKLSTFMFKHKTNVNGDDVTGILPGLGSQALAIRPSNIDLNTHYVYAAPNTGESDITGQFIKQTVDSYFIEKYSSSPASHQQKSAVYEFEEVINEAPIKPNEIKVDNFYGTGGVGLNTTFDVGLKTSRYKASCEHPERLNFLFYSYGDYGPSYEYMDVPEYNVTFSEGDLKYYGFDLGSYNGSYYKNYDQQTLTAWGRTSYTYSTSRVARYTFTVYDHNRNEPSDASPDEQPYLYVQWLDEANNYSGIGTHYTKREGDYFLWNDIQYEVVSFHNRGPITGPLNGGHPYQRPQVYKIRVNQNFTYTQSEINAGNTPGEGQKIYLYRPTEEIKAPGTDDFGRLKPPGATDIFQLGYNAAQYIDYAPYGTLPGRFDNDQRGYFPDSRGKGAVMDTTEIFNTTAKIGDGLTTFFDNSGIERTIVMLIEVVHDDSQVDNRDNIDHFPFVQARGRLGPNNEWSVPLEGQDRWGDRQSLDFQEALSERNSAEKYAWTGITLSLAGIEVPNSDDTFKEVIIEMNGNSVTLSRDAAVYNPRFNGSSHWTWPEPTPRKQQPSHTNHSTYISVLNNTGTATLVIK